MKVGRRLATKLLNVSKFVLGISATTRRRRSTPSPIRSTGRCWPASTPSIAEATTAFDGFDYARALERTEAFFWWFCDDYVELVKGRAYGGRGDDAAASAHRRRCASPSSALQRLFAPILPFATEEAWSWWHDTSVHAAAWPAASGVAGGAASTSTSSARCSARVRRAKTEAKQSQRAERRHARRVTVPAALRAGARGGARRPRRRPDRRSSSSSSSGAELGRRRSSSA